MAKTERLAAFTVFWGSADLSSGLLSPRPPVKLAIHGHPGCLGNGHSGPSSAYRDYGRVPLGWIPHEVNS